MNAIPSRATAVCQLRFVVGTDWQNLVQHIDHHLRQHGFDNVRGEFMRGSPATRLNPQDQLVAWALNSLARSSGKKPALLPNLGGSLPNEVFADILGLPTLMSSIVQSSPQVTSSLHKTLFATCIGNALEWFDIAVYGFFASYIAYAFFPVSDPSVSLLLTFGSFGIAFLIHPLGALVLGNYADRHGRKKALLLSINLIMLGGAIITFIVAVTVFCGFAPLICSMLIAATGSSLAPGYYLMAVAVLSGVALLRSSKRLG